MNFDELKKCVVKILGPEGKTVRGTGFFASSKGFILTCHHVIADLPKLTIEYDGKQYDVEWRQDVSSPERDIAVLKIDPETLHTPIPNIEPSDFGDEVRSGAAVDAYGFPYKKRESFGEGFDVHGILAPGQSALIRPRGIQRRAIKSLKVKAPWSFLPSDEEIQRVQVCNVEGALAQAGVSGAPVLRSESGQIVGFISASEPEEQRAYVIKWENVRFRWGNFPLNPFPSQLPPPEWAVTDGVQTPGFLDKVQELRLAVEEAFGGEREDLVITLYAKSFPKVSGIGSFEYDLLYYWGLFDPTHMFGPIIPGDERTRITEEKTKAWDTKHDPMWKEGGFIVRERVLTAAWFKLGDRLWADGYLDRRKKVTPDSIRGLLFINARKPGLTRKALHDSSRFVKALAAIEEVISEVIKKRDNQHNRRCLELFRAFRPPNNVDHLANVKRAEEIASDDIITMFSSLVSVFEAISRNSNLAFTVFAYERERKRLNWLWSNGPTSVDAFMPLSRFSGTLGGNNTPLPVQVALDKGHRPRLVHHLQSNEKYQDCAIRTKHGGRAQSNLIVPILSSYRGNDDKQLLGVIDIQGLGETEFDTDDVQLVYEFASRYISNFIAKVTQVSRVQATSTTLLSPKIRPFEKQALKFGIRDLLELNFNPMKYLFHWDRIKGIIMGEPVQFPSLVEVWPSMRCNHRCDWCRTENELRNYRGRNEYIGRHGLLALARDLVEQDQVDVLISGGGEPLLHPDIHEFMKLLRDGGVKGTVGIFTNGTRPKDFRFWEYFFAREGGHSFVRISFNGHDPKTYYEIHFDARAKENGYPDDHQRHYAEASKMVLDLLGMRSGMCTVALGSTVHSQWQDTIESQVEHAEQLGVDFIQVRPELIESSRPENRLIWQEIKKAVENEEKRYHGEQHFAVKYTDGERAYKDHDYDMCYAMYLVPALMPDIEEGWLRVLPCSYAINKVGKVPKLGTMEEGTKLSDFWDKLDRAMRTGKPISNADGIRNVRHEPIDPSRGCPQCRYYMLNKRIIEIKDKIESIRLITQLVEDLEANPHNISSALINDIEDTWDRSIVNVEQAKRAFTISKELGIRPSL